jgi:uncharacterized protein YybS (DUF2232 family)
MLITIGSTCLIYLSGIFTLWTPLPLVYRWKKDGPRAFFIAAFFTGAVIVVLSVGKLLTAGGLEDQGRFWGHEAFVGSLRIGSFQALTIAAFLLYALKALILSQADQKKWFIEKTFAAASMIPLIVIALIGWFYIEQHHIPLMQFLHEDVSEALKKGESIMTGSDVTAQQAHYLQVHSDRIARDFIALMPAGLVIVSLVTVWFNILGLRMWFPKMNFFNGLGDLSLWKLNDGWIWLLIGLGLFLFLDMYMLQMPWLGIFLTNALWVIAAIYFLHGMAIAVFYLKNKFGPLMRFLFYMMVIFTIHISALFFVVLGVLDLWFDFRKRAAVKSA